MGPMEPWKPSHGSLVGLIADTYGTLELWNPGTLETLEPWKPWNPGNSATLELWKFFMHCVYSFGLHHIAHIPISLSLLSCNLVSFGDQGVTHPA